jgi:hypothetical protein
MARYVRQFAPVAAPCVVGQTYAVKTSSEARSATSEGRELNYGATRRSLCIRVAIERPDIGRRDSVTAERNPRESQLTGKMPYIGGGAY